MHEMALAEAVIATAVDAARDRKISRVTRVGVTVGELQNIDSSVFAFVLEELRSAADSMISSAQFTVEREPARFRCRPCGREFRLGDGTALEGEAESEAVHFVPELAHAFLHCPECKSPDFEVVEGRGVAIATLEGV